MALACCTYQEQPTATPCCPAGRRRRWRWRSSPSISISGDEASVDCFPFFFLVLLPLPCVLYVVCLCGRKHKQSKRWGSEARGAAGRKGRQPTTATATASLQLQLLVYIWCYPRSVAHCNLQTTRTTFCQTRERQIKGQVQTTVRKESSSLVFVCLTMTSECESTLFYLLRLYVLLLEYTH